MSDGKKLKPLHAPKAPHEDPEFLNSTPARPIRILAEYIHPLVQLKREGIGDTDRKSTRLNSSHGYISYAVFCLKKKKQVWFSVHRRTLVYALRLRASAGYT